MHLSEKTRRALVKNPNWSGPIERSAKLLSSKAAIHSYGTGLGLQHGAFSGVFDPASELIKFEYEGHEYQSSTAFDDWPGSHGFATNDLLSGAVSDAKSHLRTWFYFGMLHEVLGLIEHGDFIVMSADGTISLCTLHLEKVTLARRKALESMSADTREADDLRAYRCLESVSGYLYSDMYAINIKDTLGDKFTLAVAIPGASLSYAVSTFAGQMQDSGRIRRINKFPRSMRKGLLSNGAMLSNNYYITRSPTNTFLDDRMHEGGWCPTEIDRFQRMTTPLVQAYALGFQRPDKAKHRSCTSAGCIADNIDTATYQTRHINHHCQCPLLSVDINAVKNILEKDPQGIPLVEISRTSESTPELKVAEHQPGRRYIAISHVWADGLGNQEHNALHCCRISRLLSLCKDLSKTTNVVTVRDAKRQMPFAQRATLMGNTVLNAISLNREVSTIWMDTCCVPVEEGPRKIAISRMNEAYQKGKLSR